MAPSAVALQLLRALFLVRAQLIDASGIHVVRDVNLHSRGKAWLASGLSLRRADAAPLGIALKKTQPVVIRLNAESVSGWHH